MQYISRYHFLIRYTGIHLSYVCSDTATHNTAKIEGKMDITSIVNVALLLLVLRVYNNSYSVSKVCSSFYIFVSQSIKF
jgi:hypothetical protein